MTIGPDSVVTQDSEPIAAKVDDEVVMLSVRAEAYFGLGTIGSEIWNMIARPRRVSDICAELTSSHDVESSICERDVVAFLTTLSEHGLIRMVGGNEPAS